MNKIIQLYKMFLFYKGREKREKEETDTDDDDTDAVPDLLSTYIKSLQSKEYDPLPPADLEKYLREYQKTHNLEIKKKIAKSFLRLVSKIAFKYEKQNTIEMMDLIQSGNERLLKCIEAFNPDNEKGTTFYSYVSWSLDRTMVHDLYEEQKKPRCIPLDYTYPSGDSIADLTPSKLVTEEDAERNYMMEQLDKKLRPDQKMVLYHWIYNEKYRSGTAKFKKNRSMTQARFDIIGDQIKNKAEGVGLCPKN